MKKLLISFLLATLIMMPTSLFGAEFETPHEFSAGDTISADMMNEIFDYIKNANKMISASELIGTWSCLLYTRSSECRTAGWDNATDGVILPYVHNTDNITLIDDGDGTYSYTTPVPNIFSCSDKVHAGFGDWIVKNNALWIVFSSGGNAGEPTDANDVKVVKLKKVSNSKLLMEYNSASIPVLADCDKCCQPPIAPTLDNVTSSGKTVTLTWTDNSNDETGFNVWRKDSNEGSWDNVTSSVTIVDATASDTVTEAKKYWYRVSANNSYGESTRSKVITVDVE